MNFSSITSGSKRPDHSSTYTGGSKRLDYSGVYTGSKRHDDAHTPTTPTSESEMTPVDPDVPHGLGQLALVKHLVVRQLRERYDTIRYTSIPKEGWPQNHIKFLIFSQDERTSCCEQLFHACYTDSSSWEDLHFSKGMTLRFTDLIGENILRLDISFKGTSEDSANCAQVLNAQNNSLLGSVKNTFDVLDDNDNKIFQVPSCWYGKCCCCCKRKDNLFHVKRVKPKQEVALITRMLPEKAAGDDDKPEERVLISFIGDLDVQEKALILGAAFFLSAKLGFIGMSQYTPSLRS